MSLISDITFKANNNSGIESINSKNSEKTIKYKTYSTEDVSTPSASSNEVSLKGSNLIDGTGIPSTNENIKKPNIYSIFNNITGN